MSEKDQSYETKLLRLVDAELCFASAMYASHEMYAKSYFSLGVVEKQAVDQMVLNQISGNFQAITPAWFGQQTEAPKAGFHQSEAEKATEK